jgi:hypothetical protein
MAKNMALCSTVALHVSTAAFCGYIFPACYNHLILNLFILPYLPPLKLFAMRTWLPGLLLSISYFAAFSQTAPEHSHKLERALKFPDVPGYKR